MRFPVVAGQFYAGTKEELLDQIKRCYIHSHGPGGIPKPAGGGKRKIVGLVSPHAGYEFSGPVAAHGFKAVAEDGVPEVVALIGPSHQWEFREVYVDPKGVWRTPLGDIQIDEELAKDISKEVKFLVEDSSAHAGEHSLEVQLPFLQHLFGEDFKIVPILMGAMDIDTARDLGRGVAKAVKKSGKDVLILASSDFIHFGSAYEYAPVSGDEALGWVKKVDLETAKAMEKFDLDGFYSILEKYRSTTCGYGAIGACMVASEKLGAKRGILLKHATSSETAGGGPFQMVDYISMVFKKG